MNNEEVIIQLRAFEKDLPIYFCKKEEMCFSDVVESDEELDMIPIGKITLMEDKIVLTERERK